MQTNGALLASHTLLPHVRDTALNVLSNPVSVVLYDYISCSVEMSVMPAVVLGVQQLSWGFSSCPV